MKALKGAFADRPIVSVPNVPPTPVPTGDPAVLRAVADEIAARRPDIARAPVPAGQLDRFVARVTSDEPTINDVASLLHLIGTVDTVDPSRLQALCVLAARALGNFDAHARHAPPSALNDLVADALSECAASPDNGCSDLVAPWDGPVTCGTDECATTYARMVGDYS